jgi:hypothetical protein
MDDGADLPTDVLVDTRTATSLRSGAVTLAATKKLAPSTSSSTTTYHLQLQQSDAAGRCQ